MTVSSIIPYWVKLQYFFQNNFRTIVVGNVDGDITYQFLVHQFNLLLNFTRHLARLAKVIS